MHDSSEVWWGFHLKLPEGMHWKAGDHYGGLGSDHHESSQSFDEFLKKPQHELPEKEHAKAIKLINEAIEAKKK